MPCNIRTKSFEYIALVLSNTCINGIAIYSQNCVRIWKGRDRKTVFSGWDIKDVEQTARLFYVKPCKKMFSDQSLSLMRKIFWEHITFYVKTTLFCEQEDWKTPCLLH